MARFAELVPAPSAKKAGPASAAAGPRPRRLSLAQRAAMGQAIQRRAGDSAAPEPAPKASNRSGLPQWLKAGIERLSGLAMGDVHVHRDSPEPAKLGALAYTKGSDIHLGPGQDKHLPHEAWHVVQQKQGRVKATTQMEGQRINSDVALEDEADRFGSKAASGPLGPGPVRLERGGAAPPVVQRRILYKGAPLNAPAEAALFQIYIQAGATYILEDTWSQDYTVPQIYLLEQNRKYLLGEIHGDGSWQRRVARWRSVPKLSEKVRFLPLPAAESAALHGAVGNRAQALESLHGASMHFALTAMRVLGRIIEVAQRWPTLPEPVKLEESGKAAAENRKAIRWLRRVQKAVDAYASFARAYEKQEADHPGSSTAPARALHAMIRIISRVVPDFAPLYASLVRLSIKIAAYPRVRSGQQEIRADGARIATALESIKQVYLLSVSLSGADPAREAILTGFAANPAAGQAASRTASEVRDRSMAARIASHAAPLLVQLGDGHAPRVHARLGQQTVLVRAGEDFEEVTSRMIPRANFGLTYAPAVIPT